MMKSVRYPLIDFLKGFAILNVIAFHLLYDLYVMTGKDVNWPFGFGISLWQEVGISLLIALAGMSAKLMGQAKRWRNGWKLTLLGIGISLGTYLFMPEELILYGVLSFFGSSLLLTAVLELWALLERLRPVWGVLLCVFAYLLTWRVGDIEAESDVLAVLGLRSAEFFSADYVPLLPYIFVFWSGFYGLSLLQRYLPQVLLLGKWKPLEWCGKHSLLIYLLHQPILLFILTILGII